MLVYSCGPRIRLMNDVNTVFRKSHPKNILFSAHVKNSWGRSGKMMFTGGSHYKKRNANRNSGRRNDRTSRATNPNVSGHTLFTATKRDGLLSHNNIRGLCNYEKALFGGRSLVILQWVSKQLPVFR